MIPIFSLVDSTDVVGSGVNVLAAAACSRGLHKTFRTLSTAGAALRPAALRQAPGVLATCQRRGRSVTGHRAGQQLGSGWFIH